DFADPDHLGADTSPSANPASIVQGADITTGPMGAALHVDGAGLVQIDPGTGLRFADQVTAEAWIKTGATGPAQIIGKWHGLQPGWRLSTYPGTGQLFWEVRTTIGGPKGAPPKTG